MRSAKAARVRPLAFTALIGVIGAIAGLRGLARRHYSLAMAGVAIVLVAAALGYSVWRTVGAARRQS